MNFMKPNVMISYSRQQTPFVDAFYKDLVKAGYDVWLDYQKLVPSEPWFDQIAAGVEKADAVLLVVSEDSMGSKNVEDEWDMALKAGKRVILVLFEATPIKNEKLKKCEYVDFRVNYKAGLKELDEKLKNKAQPEAQRPSIPESGFKASFTFWVVLVISLLLAVGSISAIWTVFIPFVLIPLPMRIFRRNYNFSQVAPTLFLMPVFFAFSDALLRAEGNIFYLLPDFVFTLGGIAAVLAWVLLGLLISPAMRLRARPEAVPARVVNRTKISEEVKLRSIRFFIDHAPEDGRYANDLRRVLEKHGHEYVENGVNPEAVFVFLSAYKKETTYKAGKGLSLFPIVLQKIGRIEGDMGRIQWLDFRRGMKNLDKVAKLLPEPEKLVKVLAVPPTGRQEVFPLPVNLLQFFYIITGVMGGGGLLTTVLSLMWLRSLGFLQTNLTFFQILAGIVNGLLLFGAVYYSVHALRTRTSGLAAVYPLAVLTVFQAGIHSFSYIILGLNSGAEFESELETLLFSASNANGFAANGYLLGLAIILPVLAFNWQDFLRWLPMGKPGRLSRLEHALLLYSPETKLKLIFHMLFHALILMLLFVEGFMTSEDINDKLPTFLCFITPITLGVFFFHKMATRKSA
jgi:hypothetical protein